MQACPQAKKDLEFIKTRNYIIWIIRKYQILPVVQRVDKNIQKWRWPMCMWKMPRLVRRCCSLGRFLDVEYEGVAEGENFPYCQNNRLSFPLWQHCKMRQKLNPVLSLISNILFGEHSAFITWQPEKFRNGKDRSIICTSCQNDASRSWINSTRIVQKASLFWNIVKQNDDQ